MGMDIRKGWPARGAIDGNGQTKDGENIIAGMGIKLDAAGLLVKATGAAGEKAFFALADQNDGNVDYSGSMAYIIKNAVVATDQYIAGVYVYGDDLEVASGGNAGKIQKHTGGGAPVYGTYYGTHTKDNIDMILVII